MGVFEERLFLDLDYEEDANCEVDLNIVMKSDMSLVEIQGTGERATFQKHQLIDMITVAENGLEVLFKMQKIMSQNVSVKRLASSDI